ncbi:MAG: ABC transporter permease [Terriglobia bacterium]|jgi:predicted permease
MGTVLQDLKYGLRMLAKNPGFTAVAVLTLALGIGANTAIFSVVNGVLLNPLPYPEPNQLVTLHESKPNFPYGSISYLNFRDWQKENHTFSSIAVARGYGFTLTGAGEPERVRAEFVSSDFFPLLGVKPLIGRTFAPGEDEIGAAPIALVSAGFWKRKFGSAREILGKALILDGRSYTIVGVIPSSFDLLLKSFSPKEVYIPIGQWDHHGLKFRGAGLGIHGIGRLKPGVTLQQARADMDGVTRNLAVAYPDADKGISAGILPLREDMVGDIQPFLLVLLGAVGFVLLIACVNVANLLLARSAGRRREFAVRVALGASPQRVIRQLLTESVLLALAGGGLGTVLAAWGTQAALKILPAALPRAPEIGIDAHVLVFTAVASVLAGILFGLAPALKISKPNLQETLKEAGRGTSGAHHRTQGVFVVIEMATALVLLIGAGLMTRTLARLWGVNPGFDPHNVLTFELSLPPAMKKASPDAIRAAYREFDAKLGSTPGVQAVSLSWGAIPMDTEDDEQFWIEGQPKPSNENEMNWALEYTVEPDYLRVMRIPLERGRFFTPQDNERSPAVAVIDDVLARKYFPNQNPIGKRINLHDYDDQPAEIVGVVGHVKQWGLDSDDTQSLRAQLYHPFMQLPGDALALSPLGMGVLVRSEGAATSLFTSLRHTNELMNKEQVIYSAQTMNEVIAGSLATRQFSMILLGSFALLALVLASVGIYGVLAYLVGQRTHEIGIRLALGASRYDVLRLVVGQGAKMALLGVALGLAAAMGLTRLMSDMLYGVSATDPLTFTAVAILLILVALVACYIPARRATKVDPMVALRYE